MTDTLLSRSEVTACKKLAASDGLPAARAKALLALHDQRTQAQAAETSGLTVGQVRYALSTFKRKGMGLFEAAKPTTGSSAARKAVSVKAKSDKAGKRDKKSQKAKSDKKDKKSTKKKKTEAKDKKSGKSKKDKSAKKKKKSGKKK